MDNTNNYKQGQPSAATNKRAVKPAPRTKNKSRSIPLLTATVDNKPFTKVDMQWRVKTYQKLIFLIKNFRENSPQTLAQFSDPNFCLPEELPSILRFLSELVRQHQVVEVNSSSAADKGVKRSVNLILEGAHVLRHMLLVPGASNHRALGLTSDATLNEITDHYHWLREIFLYDEKISLQHDGSLQITDAYASLKSLSFTQPENNSIFFQDTTSAHPAIPTNDFSTAPTDSANASWPFTAKLTACTLVTVLGIVTILQTYNQSSDTREFVQTPINNLISNKLPIDRDALFEANIFSDSNSEETANASSNPITTHVIKQMVSSTRQQNKATLEKDLTKKPINTETLTEELSDTTTNNSEPVATTQRGNIVVHSVRTPKESFKTVDSQNVREDRPPLALSVATNNKLHQVNSRIKLPDENSTVRPQVKMNTAKISATFNENAIEAELTKGPRAFHRLGSDFLLPSNDKRNPVR